MWIFSTIGLFSTVKADRGRVCIRARTRRHIEALCKRFPELKLKWSSCDTTDYRYRVLTKKENFVTIVEELALEVEYPNFKSECAKSGDEQYDDCLHDVWAVGMSMQKRERNVELQQEWGQLSDAQARGRAK